MKLYKKGSIKMSYGRITETGHYIWPDDEGVHFDDNYVPDETLNIFLARLVENRPKEFKDRVKQGKLAIKKNKMNIGDLK